MKVALVNLCKIEDFAIHKSYNSSISFLKENGIDYADFATGASRMERMVECFSKALDSDAELLWFIRGGNKSIQALDKIHWDKVISSDKKFYGLSDFTHFSTMAVSRGTTCYYGQGLTNITDYFPTEADREFITRFLQTGLPVCAKAKALTDGVEDLDVSNMNIVGGHLFIFTLMQGQLHISLKDRYLFIEYHNGVLGEKLDDLAYYIDQLLYILKDNLPKGFILGKTELRNEDGSQVDLDQVNQYCVEKLNKYNLPIYFLDHYKNTITFR